MKNRRSNWQIVVSGIMIFAVWFGALPSYAQTKRDDGKGVGNKVVTELPSKEKRWALIVGIDEYQNDVSSLKGAVNDAKALKNVLVNNAGFPENQIILLTTDSAEQDKRPTRENILGALRDIHKRVDEDGLLLFSFSGHGISIGEQAFLIPSNGSFTKNLSLLEDFSIDVSRIKRAIQEMKVKQVLMLIDACRNEPGKGDVPNKLTDAYKNGFSFDVANSDVKAFATLYATSIGERAYEYTRENKGYFTWAFIEGLKGGAANENGEVTLGALIRYVEKYVPQQVKIDLGSNKLQRPFSIVEGYKAEELVLGIVKNSKSNITVQTPSQISPSATPSNTISQPNLGNSNKDKSSEVLETNSSSRTVFESLLFKEMVINSGKYEYVRNVSDELAAASDKITRKISFLNREGKVVISAINYDSAGSFSEGLVDVRIGFSLDSKYGFIDKTGKEVIPVRYDYANPFSEGLAMVAMKDGKAGFIDKTGREVIPRKYDLAYSFSDGLALVQLKEKYGFIDKSGREVIPIKLSKAASFSEGIAPVKIDERWMLIDKTGKEVVRLPKYYSVSKFSEGMAEVRDGDLGKGRAGFIDKSGKEIIAPKFFRVLEFSESLAGVSIPDNGRELWGFIDKNGNEIVSPKYESVWSFSNGLAKVRLGNKYGYINKTGKVVIPIKYETVWCETFIREGFIGVTLGGVRGFVDIYGNEYFDF